MMAPSKCKLFLLCILVAALLAGGCGGKFPFARPLEVEQGNRLKAEDIERLQLGMSKAEVRRLLGEPVLKHPFEAQRWDYLYDRRGSERAHKRLTLRFEDGQVAEMENAWTEGSS